MGSTVVVPAEIVKPGTVVSVASEPTRSKLAALYHYATPLDVVFFAAGCFCKAGLGFLQTYVLIIFGEFFVIDGGRSYIEMGEFMLWAMCIFGAAILGVECTRMVKAPPARPLRGQSALARPLCLLRARLAALSSSVLPGRGRATGRPATASGARASRLQSCRFHRL